MSNPSEQSIGDYENERRSNLEGVVAGTVSLHQWGLRPKPHEVMVLHEVAIKHGEPGANMDQHLAATQFIARTLGGINPLEISYLGEMTRASAAAELAGRVATANS